MDWRRGMGVEPTQERWRSSTGFEILPPSPEMTPSVVEIAVTLA